jgi:hypothetical protein
MTVAVVAADNREDVADDCRCSRQQTTGRM